MCSAAFLTGTLFLEFLGAGAASAEEAPPSGAAATAPPPHTVVAGENLWSISGARLGASERWIEVYLLNRDVLTSPNLVEVGQVLRIPAGPVAVPSGVVAGLGPASAPPRTTAARTRVTRAPRTGRSKAVARADTGRRSAAPSGGGDLAGIRRCESGGNYQAVSSSGKYRGAYQFDRRTWQSVGGSGDPAAASPAEQDARARRLKSQRGSSPWANCG
ncbi:MAG: transglycosylase family protein [Actinomycetota bacterium]|nr:transglycosylase family protein [Actinomycetota bacterium]